MSSYRRYYLPSVSWSDVKGGVWRIQPYNVTDYFFIFRVQNLLTSAVEKRDVSWIGAKSQNRGKSPKAKKGEAGWIGGKVEKQNICSNRKKRREKQVGVKKQKKEELLQQKEIK